MDELVPKPVNVSVLKEILLENIEYDPWNIIDLEAMISSLIL